MKHPVASVDGACKVSAILCFFFLKDRHLPEEQNDSTGLGLSIEADLGQEGDQDIPFAAFQIKSSSN